MGSNLVRGLNRAGERDILAVDEPGDGRKRYISFPKHLERAYRSYTRTDITKLRRAGYDRPFASVATGVKSYLDSLEGSASNSGECG